MVAVSTHAQVSPPRPDLHAGFVALLPRVERCARAAFRHVPCPGHRADAVAEVVALAWAWYRRCAERGKDAAEFPAALAGLAARAVRSGRGLCRRDRFADA